MSPEVALTAVIVGFVLTLAYMAYMFGRSK